MRKRITSLFLVLTMCLTLLPTAAFAQDTQAAEQGQTEVVSEEQEETPAPEEPTEEDEPASEEQEQEAPDVEPALQEAENSTAVQADGHTHYLCGNTTCDGKNHPETDAVTFQPWNDATTLPKSGAYYLTTDVTMSGEYYPTGDVILCLNGYSITGDSLGYPPIYVKNKNTSFTLTDCNGSNGEYHFTKTSSTSDDYFGLWVSDTAGDITVTGGIVTGSGAKASGVRVENGTFNMYGGTVCGNKYSGVYLAVSYTPTFNMYGGAIRGNVGYAIGGGVYVGDGTFTMEDGTISDNVVSGGTARSGGGVSVSGTFIMNGGTISNNIANDDTLRSEGGGVYVGSGSFTMSGNAAITGNSANMGGGVYVSDGKTFNMNGGTISNNKIDVTASEQKDYHVGGGVYLGSGSTLQLSGAAVITDNMRRYAEYKNNVYLSSESTITVGEMEDGASISVTPASVPEADSSLTIAENVTEDSAKYFSSDDTQKFRVKYISADQELTVVNAEHVAHPECGETCTHGGQHSTIADSEWNFYGYSTLDRATHLISNMQNSFTGYYLTGDVTVTETIKVTKDKVLCLNGFTITADGDFDVFTVAPGVTLTICDCFGGGKITHADGKSGSGVYVAGTDGKVAAFSMYGGTIIGNMGHAVEISGNTSTRGGGVYVDGYAKFYMRGGSISGNTADVGGGVYYTASNSLYVSGNVNITGNFDTNGTKSNINVPTSSFAAPPTTSFFIGPAVLDEAARIGVRVADGVITEGSHSPVAQLSPLISDKNNAYHEGNFISDNDGDYNFKMEQDSEYDSATGTVVNLYNGQPHVHPICGKTHNDIGNHTSDCADVTWTAWDGVSGITYDSDNTAYVYLTDKAERGATLTVEKGYKLYLCLNGHSLTMSKSGVAVIKVVSGATLSLCDCSDAQTGRLTHGTNDLGSTYSGRGVTVQGTFNMYGGSITGNNTTSTGGGVTLPYEAYSARFNLYDGSITNNTANNSAEDGGGGVHILAGTFTMYGGSITGNNTTAYGGGVYLANSGEFLMKGGEITGNTAAKNGGGVYTKVNLPTGLTASGDVTITGNKNTADEDENVYLVSGKTIAISKDGLGENASIGVTSADTIDTGSYVTVTNGANNGYHENAIFGDNTEYTTLQKGDEVRLYNGIPHEHAICGTEGCTEDGHDDLNWTGISSLDEIQGDGNYYLLKAVDTEGWACKFNVNLCLNGYSISYTGSGTTAGGIIGVTDGNTLAITDCNGSGKNNGIITHGEGTSGTAISVYDGGTFNLYGGTITGNGYTSGTYNGGAVYVSVSRNANEASTFNMYGGTISGNSATFEGGGVYVVSYGSTKSNFNMYGGTISGNTVIKGHGGGVFVDENSVFNMYGGTISGNFANNHGGGVCVGLDSNATFQMTGGTITGNNTHLTYGGGVYVDTKSTFNISGNVNITGNCMNGTKDEGEAVYTGGTVNNVHLSAKTNDKTEVNVINVTGALDENAQIGVTFADSARPSSTNDGVKFAEAITESTADTTGWIKTGNFLSDESTFFVVNVMEDGKVARLNMHNHTYDVRVKSDEANVLEWVCETEGCGNIGGTLTLNAADAEYTGSAYTGAKLTAENWGNSYVDTSIDYEEKTGEDTFKQLGEAPTNAGNYRASVTLKNKAGNDVTATEEFTISRAKLSLNAGDFKFNVPDDLLYNGEAKVATVTWLSEAKATGFGNITVKYFDEDGTQLTEAPKDAGTYTVKIDVAEGIGYEAQNNISSDYWTFTINPVQQKLTFKYSTVNMIYGEGPFTNPLQETDIQGAITYKSSNENVATVDENGMVTILAASTEPVTITARTEGTTNYSAAEASFMLTVAKKGITVSEITAKDKYYDGTTTAELDCSNAALEGKLSKDDLRVTATGAFEDANAGEGKTVTITDLTLTGAAAGNYILVTSGQQTSATATISKMPLTINRVAAYKRVYEPNNKSVMISSVGFQDKDGQTVELTKGTHYTVTGEMADDNAGEGKTATATVTLIGETAKNYGLEIPTYDVNVNIDKIEPNFPTGLTGYQGNALSTVSLSGFDGWSWADGTVVMSEAGDKTFSANYAGSTNYLAGSWDLTVMVSEKSKETLVVTMPDGGWTYGGTAVDPSYTEPSDAKTTINYTGTTNGGTTYDPSREKPTEAGSYTVTVTCETFDKIYSGTAGFTIAKKPVTAPTADPTKFEYNTQEQTYTLGNLDDNSYYTVSGEMKRTDAGSQDITVQLNDKNNTVWAANPATTDDLKFTFTIARKYIYLTVALGQDTFVYDGNPKTPGITVTIGDTGTVLSADEYEVVHSTIVDAGTASVTIKDTLNGNYSFSETYVNFTITPKPLTLPNASVTTKTYDGTIAATVIPGTLSGVVGSDDVNVAETSVDGAFDNQYVGTDKTMTLSDSFTLTGDKAINYTLTQPTVTGSITAATQSPTITATASVARGGKTLDLSKLVSGVKENGTVFFAISEGNEYATLDGSTLTTKDDVGTVKITVTIDAVDLNGDGTPEYSAYTGTNAITVSVILRDAPTVTTAPIDVTGLVYNGAEQTLITAGAVEGGTLKYKLADGEYSTELPTAKNAGSYTVTYKVFGDGDHEDSIEQSFTATIQKATVTITAKDKSAYVGSTAPALTNPVEGTDYTVSGLMGEDKLDGSTVVLSYEETPDMTKAGTAVITVTGGILPSENYTLEYETGTLTITNRPSSGGGSTTYPVNVPSGTENGSVSVSPKFASKGDTVTITVEPDSGYQLDDLTVTDKDGNELKLTNKGNGQYTFTMPAGKVDVNATFAKETETSPFTDVATNAYYYEAVKWAADQGITGGIGNGLFGPNQPCTRAQIVTFLWRAAGSPEPKNMSIFSDVPVDSYYAKAVAWAVENGITTGTGDGKFSPDATCTRAQSVTFLFRASEASADGMPAFSDVAANAYYAEAVKWATDNGITNGIGNNLFGSDNDCTRAQIVTFLWRLYAGK